MLARVGGSGKTVTRLPVERCESVQMSSPFTVVLVLFHLLLLLTAARSYKYFPSNPKVNCIHRGAHSVG